MGPAGGPCGPARPLPVRWPQPRVSPRLESASGCPRTRHDLADTHTRAHTLTPCGISRPGPRLWEGPGSRNPVAGAGGPPGTPGSRPPRSACAPPPQPLSARGLGPRHGPRRPAGVPEAPGRAAGGVGGGAGGGRGLRAARRLGSAPGKVWTWETPSPPAPPRGGGARGAGAGSRAPPEAGGSPPPPTPPAGPLLPAGGLPPGWAASPRRQSRRPSRGTPRSYLGERPGAPPQSCRLGTLRGAGAQARAGESGARRPPGGAGGRAGARGGAAAACARLCASERARERGSERAGARECACLTRGEVCKGRIPSFLPQPLVETRRMQRPPGRSAAPQAAAGPGPRSRRARAPAPGARPSPARRGRPLGPTAATSQEPLGGRAPPSSNCRSTRRERPQDGPHLPPSLAAPPRPPV